MYLFTFTPFNIHTITLLFLRGYKLLLKQISYDGNHSPCLKAKYLGCIAALGTLMLLSSASFGQDIWLEAECSTVGENLKLINNDRASRSQAILMKGDSEPNAPSNDPDDRIVMEVEVAESGSYHLFGRLAAQDATANSFWVKANGGKWIEWENIGSNSFQGTETSATRAAKVPIIPGYTSFAMDSKGGRKGKVIKVTNLKDSGAGSLRACIESDGARVCVFETSGVINLKSELKISNPYITIAGQTAPDPGIILYGNMLVIRSHDVLIQHMGIRSGDINFGGNHERNSKDCISIRKGSNNIVLDHLSLAWGTDENMDISGNVGEICLRNVLFSNALNKNGHAFGALFYDRGSLAIEGSMFANLDQRQPMSRIEKLILVNNLHYNRGLRFAQFSANSSTRNRTQNTLVGNVYVEGPSRRNNAKPLLLHRGDLKSGTKMYLKDNYWKSNVNASGKLSDQWSLVQDQGGNANPKVSKPPVWVNGMKVLREENQIIDYVLQSVGPRPAKRNYLDKKVINNYKSGKGGIVDCVKGCRNNDGGLPKLAKNQRRLNIPSNPNGDNDGDGYTNLEEWLHQMAAQVEGKPYDPGETPDDPDPGLGDTFSWYKLTDADKQDQVVSLNLTEGKNTIEIARKEPGIILDKIYLSKENDTPSGEGGEASNCDDYSGPGLSSIRINAGGVKMNTSGKLFQADAYYTASSSTSVYNANIDDTPDEGLYQTERKGSEFGYNIPIENGEYDIRLRFAELTWLESGKRRFDVSMEGNRLIKDFDIFATSNFGVAADKEFLGVQVQDGILNIDFAASLGEAQICAIEVLPAGSLSNSSNTPPSFTTSGDLLLVQDFEGVEYVEVDAAPVPAAEASQEVSYSLSPAFSLISNISINSSTGLVEVRALEGIAGSEEFTITANDGQDKNNVYTQTFKLVILSDEPNTIRGGGSTIRINAGGPAFTSEGGDQFIADKFFQGNSGEYSVTNEIEGTNDDPLYQSERWGFEFSYQIPVINGEYEVILHFSEVYWSDAEKRQFDVKVEGDAYLSDYDIYQRHGKNAVGIERIEGIIITDGVLNLDFFGKKHMAKVSAIEVISTSSPGVGAGQSVRINCGDNKPKAFGGQVFQSDIGFVSSGTRSLLNESIGISSTNYDEIYQTARSSQVDGEGFGYKIPVENGKYVVYLHFAEIYWGVPGGATGGKGNRIFSIILEEEVIEETYDILSKTDAANAYVERIEIEVSDGLLDLDLMASNGKPLLSAIEVLTPADEETSIGNSIYMDQIGATLLTGIFKDVKLFPNPAVSTPKMSINSEIDGDFEMNIVDMQGRVLVRQLLRKSGQIAKYVLPTDDLPTGMYVIRLFTTLENSVSLKLIKPE